MAFPDCCPNCQDYKYCEEKGRCCEFCDYFSKNDCKFEKSKKMITEIAYKVDKGEFGNIFKSE